MTLHTLKAKLKLVCNHMLYVYDDPAKGVFDEPLMHAATDILAITMESVGFGDIENKHPECTLYFTDDPREPRVDLPSLKLYNPEPDAGGTTYCVCGLWPDQTIDELSDWLLCCGGRNPWLCEHLLDYFSQPPKILVVSVEPSGWQAEPPTAPAGQG